MNLSGVGCPEAGSLLLMPTTGELNVNYEEYGSVMSEERASPGYYSNKLNRYGIHTEVTATTRSSIARFTFPAGQANILLNVGEGLTNESGAWMPEGGNDDQQTVFYTGLYHALIHPNVLNDVNGDYPVMEGDPAIPVIVDSWRITSKTLPTVFPAMMIPAPCLPGRSSR